MVFSLAQTIASSVATAAAGKAVEKAANKPDHLKGKISIGAGLGLIALYLLSEGQKLEYMNIPKTWALVGGLAGVAYGAYCYYDEGKKEAEEVKPEPKQPTEQKSNPDVDYE